MESIRGPAKRDRKEDAVQTRVGGGAKTARAPARTARGLGDEMEAMSARYSVETSSPTMDSTRLRSRSWISILRFF